MSTATAGYLRGYFELQETEPVTVDDRTVHALRVVGRGPRTSPIDEAHQQLTPFSGRHEELESLVKHVKGMRRIRFWMTFSDSYIEHLRVLQNVGMTRIDADHRKINPTKFVP